MLIYLGWRGSVVKTSVFGLGLDLWLTGGHFVVKLSAVGQPTRPTQPSIPPGPVNE